MNQKANEAGKLQQSKVELDVPGTGFLCFDGRAILAVGIFRDGSLNLVGSDIGESFTYSPKSDEWSFRFGETKRHDFDFEHSLEVRLIDGISDDGADDRWTLSDQALQSPTWLDLVSANAIDRKLPETTLSDSEWDRFERAGYNAIQRLGFDLGIEDDDDAKVRTLLVSLQAYCVTYAVDLEAQLVGVREQIASGDLQSPRWGDWVKLPEVAPVAGTPDQVRDHVEKALAVPHAAEIRSEYMDASGDVVANATVSGDAPVSAAVPDLLKALQTLIPHVLHYAAMSAAHPDAHKDAANARAVIAKATAHQQASASK